MPQQRLKYFHHHNNIERKEMAECYSCGKEANPDSPNHFCDDCDKEFDAGTQRQKEVEARAEKLETAKAQGDSDTVSQIMGEIFQESIIQENVVKEGE
jgi:predicted amidophosphoribosyltransferase